MQVAQRLYEGVDIGGETVGLITYMRTDGVTIVPEAVSAIRGLDRARILAAVRRPVHPRIQDEGQERPGSARSHPPDRGLAQAVGCRQVPREGSGAPLRADLEARRRQPDGLRRGRADDGRHRGEGPRRQDLHAARHRFGHPVRGLPQGVRGRPRRAPARRQGQGRRSRRRRGYEPPPAGAGAGRQGDGPVDRGRAALHAAAAPLLGGDAGQEDGRARHRPPVDLRLDARRAAGARLRPHRQEAPHSRGQGPAGHRLPRRLLQALRRIRFHRRPRGEARPHLRRQARLEGRAARLLARVHRLGRRHQGPARRRGAGSAERDPRPAHLPRPRGRLRSALVPVMQGRAPEPQDLRQVRRLHRLRELSRVPLHAPAQRCRQRRRRGGEPGRQAARL